MRRAAGATSAPEFVVARGLSDVDGVVDAIDHVEIVAGEGGTEERLLVAQAGSMRRKMDADRSSHSLSVAPSTLTTLRLLGYG